MRESDPAHPWRNLHHCFPDIEVVYCDLPDDVGGWWDGDRTIYLDQRLTQRGRRSALAHELWHIRRGVVPRDAVLRAREEATVDELAARELITIESLIAAVLWCRGVSGADMADEVWTDPHTLGVRLATLNDDERAQIEDALAECDWHT